MSSTLANRVVKSSTCLLDQLLRRNLVANIYPESEEYRAKLKYMLKKPQTVYAGFDATSDSLHVGNLATIMNLLHFQRHGHKVICLIGDATTQIGDPSGHKKDRLKLSKDVIELNAKAIEETLVKLFNNHSKYWDTKGMQKPIIVKNSEWYKGRDVVDFVGEIFREVRVGWLLHKKSIIARLKEGDGMNMSEFCYQIFQAYDWLELRRLYDCRLQLGGSDQAGNIYTGHDLIKRQTGAIDSVGILAPLLIDEVTGKKLGKSSDSGQTSTWLHKNKTSPYNLYQFFHRVPDNQVEKYLKVFSLYDDRTIEEFIYTHLKKPEDAWFCQKRLAESVCQLVHGEEGLNSAKRITEAFFKKNPLEIANLTDDELYQLFDSNSIINIMHKEDLRVIDLMRRANCVGNDFDAERLISGGAVRINESRVTSYNVPITTDLIIGNDITLMRIGKKNYFLFKWIS